MFMLTGSLLIFYGVYVLLYTVKLGEADDWIGHCMTIFPCKLGGVPISSHFKQLIIAM